ncbi:FecCD family ABC transporter permease [Oceanisphaera psychrotolerans]|uniref:Iron ABC transporter n=1 Tax=Oceanisphaera psychrotolerans TaxID=1414654 RepID=A0A1J4QFU9_9GAMM|nr:iron ABC transporter permease [Oceanisphaera psychrotolerans]OIN13510.1 hypothetical protein BFR47_10135 [Oceanisphaera psychrotolerans]
MKSLIFALILVPVLLWCGLALGRLPLSSAQIWAALLGQGEGLASVVVWELRLPRALLAFVVGASLALSGLVMQQVSRNPLASPGLTGVSAGAALAVVAGILLLKAGVNLTPWLAIIGGLGAGLLTLLLAGGRQLQPTRIVLAGVAVTALCGGLTTTLLLRAEADAGEFLFWMAGGVAGRSWPQLLLLLCCMAPPLLALWLTRRNLELLSGGDDMALSLGLKPARWRAWYLVLATVLAASTVAVAGPIGFVGLLAPHMVRFCWPGRRLPMGLSLLLGGVLLMSADLLARLPGTAQEIPLGVMTALLGGPLLLWLMVKEKV